jgi:hypothetical protein
VACPSDSSIEIVIPDPQAWEDVKLRFNELARGLTPAQRRQLLRRDGYCCRVPGCTNRIWLHCHHQIPYCQGGPTTGYNLVFLCSGCHKNVHDGKLVIVKMPDESLVFQDSEGRRLDRPCKLMRAIWVDHWFGWKGFKTGSRWAKVSAREVDESAA